MKKQITVAIVGLGGRGKDTYAKCQTLFPDEMKIVAIADIVPTKVQEVARLYDVPAEGCFASAEELLAQPQLADALFICTPDQLHYTQAIKALERGYHLLLEKPISTDAQEIAEIVRLSEEKNRQVVVCHVLRYTPFYQCIKSLLDDGIAGDIVSVQSIENVGYFHQAHSFVRGNWRNSALSSPMILQKCCHDLDILLWLCNKRCEAVSSFGSLKHFCRENQPKGAADRCIDCATSMKKQCPYDAEKIYLTNQQTGVCQGNDGWPCNTITLHPTEESVRQALQDGPYGRCVYACDNNVVDHQVVNLQLEDSITVQLTMCAFTKRTYRYLRIMGTLGEIEADMDQNLIHVKPFDRDDYTIDVATLSQDFSGHGGGDNRLVYEFLQLLGEDAKGDTLTSVSKSAESHTLAFAAEQSRLQGGTLIELL